jgi:hypothetical protein
VSIFLLRPLAISASVLALSFWSEPARGQASSTQLKEAARKIIRDAPATFEKPEFWIDDCYFYYRFGGRTRNPQHSRQFADIPADSQLLVELIRDLNWPEKARRVWNDCLPKLEQVIAQELDLIAKGNDDPAALLQGLHEKESLTSQMLYGAVCEIARLECRQLAPWRPLRPTYAPTWCQDVPQVFYSRARVEEKVAVAITFVTEPDDGRVFYLKERKFFDHRTRRNGDETELRQNDDLWSPVLGSREELEKGPYVLRVKWKDATVRIIKNVNVNHEDKFVLRKE